MRSGASSPRSAANLEEFLFMEHTACTAHPIWSFKNLNTKRRKRSAWAVRSRSSSSSSDVGSRAWMACCRMRASRVMRRSVAAVICRWLLAQMACGRVQDPQTQAKLNLFIVLTVFIVIQAAMRAVRWNRETKRACQVGGRLRLAVGVVACTKRNDTHSNFEPRVVRNVACEGSHNEPP